MSDQEVGREFSPSEDQETDENRVTGLKGTIDYGVPLVSDQLSVWLQNAPTFSSNSMGEAHEGYSSMLNEVSSFDVPSSVQSEQMNHGEVSHSKEMILSELEKGQSSGTKRMHASDSLGMQTKESDLQEDGEEKGPETSHGCKPQKRTRSAEVHNLNERLRRQKLKEKIKALRELIPNCNKRDKASTLDDAIKYIKTLQCQVQMMSIGAGYPTFHSPLTMMPQPGQRTLANSTFLQTGGLSEMTYEIGMRTPGMFSPLNFPTSQLGLPDQYLLPSSAASGLPGISAAAHSVQNPGNFLYATSFQSSGSQSTTPGDQTSPSQGAK